MIADRSPESLDEAAAAAIVIIFFAVPFLDRRRGHLATSGV